MYSRPVHQHLYFETKCNKRAYIQNARRIQRTHASSITNHLYTLKLFGKFLKAVNVGSKKLKHFQHVSCKKKKLFFKKNQFSDF